MGCKISAVHTIHTALTSGHRVPLHLLLYAGTVCDIGWATADMLTPRITIDILECSTQTWRYMVAVSIPGDPTQYVCR